MLRKEDEIDWDLKTEDDLKELSYFMVMQNLSSHKVKCPTCGEREDVGISALMLQGVIYSIMSEIRKFYRDKNVS